MNYGFLLSFDPPSRVWPLTDRDWDSMILQVDVPIIIYVDIIEGQQDGLIEGQRV